MQFLKEAACCSLRLLCPYSVPDHSGKTCRSLQEGGESSVCIRFQEMKTEKTGNRKGFVGKRAKIEKKLIRVGQEDEWSRPFRFILIISTSTLHPRCARGNCHGNSVLKGPRVNLKLEALFRGMEGGPAVRKVPDLSFVSHSLRHHIMVKACFV